MSQAVVADCRGAALKNNKAKHLQSQLTRVSYAASMKDIRGADQMRETKNNGDIGGRKTEWWVWPFKHKSGDAKEYFVPVSLWVKWVIWWLITISQMGNESFWKLFVFALEVFGLNPIDADTLKPTTSCETLTFVQVEFSVSFSSQLITCFCHHDYV